MAVRVVADGNESRCRCQWGSLQMAMRIVADGCEGRCIWQWGSLQMAARVAVNGSEGRCRWQWGSFSAYWTWSFWCQVIHQYSMATSLETWGGVVPWQLDTCTTHTPKGPGGGVPRQPDTCSTGTHVDPGSIHSKPITCSTMITEAQRVIT